MVAWQRGGLTGPGAARAPSGMVLALPAGRLLRTRGQLGFWGKAGSDFCLLPVPALAATHSSILAWRSPQKEPGRLVYAAAKSLQSYPTLCDPIDVNLYLRERQPGGERVLEWVRSDGSFSHSCFSPVRLALTMGSQRVRHD